MVANLSIVGSAAIKPAGQTVSESVRRVIEPTSTDQTVTDESDWFAQMAQALLGKDAGYALNRITGFEERTCYRYAAGDRKPPAYFLRALLRSDIGPQVLAYLMQGSMAAWWQDYERAKRVTARIDALDLK